jgi:hypothetical protein
MGLPVQVTTVNAPYQAASYTGVLPDESRLGSDRQPAGHKPITGYYLANPLIPLYEWPAIRPERPLADAGASSQDLYASRRSRFTHTDFAGT